MPMKKSLTLKVFTPHGLIHNIENLSTINVPLENGYPIGILPGHAPLIAGTAQGSLQYRQGNLETTLALYAGILKIRNNEVIVFTAGEFNEDNRKSETPAETDYDRLMETLVSKIKAE